MKLNEINQKTLDAIFIEWIESDPTDESAGKRLIELDKFLEQALPREQYLTAEELSGYYASEVQRAAFQAGFINGVRYRKLINAIEKED